jgi:di/tricarboxylate transporter
MAPTATGEVMLAGALGMVLFGVITMEQAYRSVEWSTVFMVAGVLPMGLALQKSGAADLIAHTLVGTAGRAGEAVLLAALVGVTVLFVQAMHGQGVTAVMVPIAITAAQQIGVDPRGFAMAVALGASIAFMTPLGHPVNLLVMSSGGYRFRDYWRVGWPLTVMLVVLVVALVPVVFPFHR